jgi:hypothetical protein
VVLVVLQQSAQFAAHPRGKRGGVSIIGNDLAGPCREARHATAAADPIAYQFYSLKAPDNPDPGESSIAEAIAMWIIAAYSFALGVMALHRQAQLLEKKAPSLAAARKMIAAAKSRGVSD